MIAKGAESMYIEKAIDVTFFLTHKIDDDSLSSKQRVKVQTSYERGEEEDKWQQLL